MRAMMKRIYSIALTSIFILSTSNQLLADIHSKIQTCALINDDNTRLACFDNLVHKNNKAKTLVAPDNISQNNLNESAIVSDNQQLEVLTAASAVQKLEQNSTDTKAVEAKQPPKVLESRVSASQDSFGKQEKEDIESIESRIIGKFRGWKKGTKLTLENGQVWKVLSSGEVYSRVESPKIKISIAVFGTFSAKVEGVTPRAKVKRIK